MSIGAEIYGYRNNFNCQKTEARKGKSTKIKLFNLIIDGYRIASKYDDDYFISIAQFFLKKGYPLNFSVNENTENLSSFFMKALFSTCPFHYQNLIINANKFNIFEWRKQFELFAETEIKGLNFYKNRDSMPLENFTSLRDIYKIIFTKYNKYNAINELLKFSFNSSWKDAVWILAKYCVITMDKFYYKISYGCRDDYENMLKNTAHSSWDIYIESEVNENYVDFCLRIYNNYEAIVSGSKDVLISERYQNDEKNFYLGGNFKLRTASLE